MYYQEDAPQYEQPRALMRHYHGDATRILFMTVAILMFVGATLGADLPFSSFGTVLFAVVLVVAAGVTNPAQKWIHYINVVLAVFGMLTYGPSAIDHYNGGAMVWSITFFVIEGAVLLFLLALYFTVKTVRGVSLRPNPS
jgi:hypothetical protein